MIVDIIDETGALDKDTEQFLREVLACAAQMNEIQEDRELALVITGNNEIRKLNNEWRGKDCATDVLSFAYDEVESPGIPDCNMPLGDIMISMEKVEEQAQEFGHSSQRELAYLATHGFLHLIGYDHLCQEEQSGMRAKEEQVMSMFKLNRENVQEENND